MALPSQFSGQSATCCACIRSGVIDFDAYAWFLERRGLTHADGRRFRDMILARAGSADAGAMHRAFRGRDAVVGPLLRNRGLVAGRRGR